MPDSCRSTWAELAALVASVNKWGPQPETDTSAVKPAKVQCPSLIMSSEECVVVQDSHALPLRCMSDEACSQFASLTLSVRRSARMLLRTRRRLTAGGWHCAASATSLHPHAA